tara:strand:+ start:127 stop:351 length:225 start_codon:yes stop_codon:yes gene_type:complete
MVRKMVCNKIFVIQPVLDEAIKINNDKKLMIMILHLMEILKNSIGFSKAKYIIPITKFKYMVKYPGWWKIDKEV